MKLLSHSYKTVFYLQLLCTVWTDFSSITLSIHITWGICPLQFINVSDTPCQTCAHIPVAEFPATLCLILWGDHSDRTSPSYQWRSPGSRLWIRESRSALSFSFCSGNEAGFQGMLPAALATLEKNSYLSRCLLSAHHILAFSLYWQRSMKSHSHIDCLQRRQQGQCQTSSGVCPAVPWCSPVQDKQEGSKPIGLSTVPRIGVTECLEHILWGWHTLAGDLM